MSNCQLTPSKIYSITGGLTLLISIAHITLCFGVFCEKMSPSSCGSIIDVELSSRGFCLIWRQNWLKVEDQNCHKVFRGVGWNRGSGGDDNDDDGQVGLKLHPGRMRLRARSQLLSDQTCSKKFNLFATKSKSWGIVQFILPTDIHQGQIAVSTIGWGSMLQFYIFQFYFFIFFNLREGQKDFQ